MRAAMQKPRTEQKSVYKEALRSFSTFSSLSAGCQQNHDHSCRAYIQNAVVILHLQLLREPNHRLCTDLFLRLQRYPSRPLDFLRYWHSFQIFTSEPTSYAVSSGKGEARGGFGMLNDRVGLGSKSRNYLPKDQELMEPKTKAGRSETGESLPRGPKQMRTNNPAVRNGRHQLESAPTIHPQHILLLFPIHRPLIADFDGKSLGTLYADGPCRYGSSDR